MDRRHIFTAARKRSLRGKRLVSEHVLLVAVCLSALCVVCNGITEWALPSHQLDNPTQSSRLLSELTAEEQEKDEEDSFAFTKGRNERRSHRDDGSDSERSRPKWPQRKKTAAGADLLLAKFAAAVQSEDDRPPEPRLRRKSTMPAVLAKALGRTDMPPQPETSPKRSPLKATPLALSRHRRSEDFSAMRDAARSEASEMRERPPTARAAEVEEYD